MIEHFFKGSTPCPGPLSLKSLESSVPILRVPLVSTNLSQRSLVCKRVSETNIGINLSPQDVCIHSIINSSVK